MVNLIHYQHPDPSSIYHCELRRGENEYFAILKEGNKRESARRSGARLNEVRTQISMLQNWPQDWADFLGAPHHFNNVQQFGSEGPN